MRCGKHFRYEVYRELHKKTDTWKIFSSVSSEGRVDFKSGQILCTSECYEQNCIDRFRGIWTSKLDASVQFLGNNCAFQDEQEVSRDLT